MKHIKDLIQTDYDLWITGITDDSREVQKGFLFVATKGFHVDHFDYIGDAVEKGCSMVISDREISYDIPYLKVEDIEKVYHTLCSKFYGVDPKEFHMIGITGTDGKTTTATIVHHLLEDYAYLGTNGLTIRDKTTTTHNTTPCVSELYESLLKMQQEHISHVVMEVSSEALLHNRVQDFCYDMVGFTNITGDHLNIHGDFDSYVSCKMKLLELVKKDGYVFVNGDDPILKGIHHPNVISFGFDSSSDYWIQNISYHKKSVLITLKKEDKEFLVESPYPGKHNVYNVVMAFLMGLYQGIDELVLCEKIKTLPPVSGRGEFLEFGQDYTIVLDYAHTIHGIESILDTFSNKRVITVTGCAGGREKEKRRTIGKMVMEKSDVSIFTMDDPRYESVDDIIDQMVGEDTNYIRMQDREEAIFYALSIAKKDDVVLILGKGRDEYMAIEDRKDPYSDFSVIQKYFS